ncbi:MAG: GntR family transcriptional regulator [Spirochaetales bacterium]|nr:GntR family transcriptional regulator [Spirochaetales bacterium]
MPHNQPKYLIIYNDLCTQIHQNKLRPGEKVPSEAELCRQHNVSRITAKQALDLAAREGLIERKPGLGSFVHSTPPTHRCRKSKKMIALVQPGLSTTYGIEMLTRFQYLTRKDGILLISAISENCTDTENEILADLADFEIDGYVVYPTHNETFNNEVLRLIIEGIPVVLVDRYLQDISCPSVVSANTKGSLLAMNHLLELGHRKIGVITRTLDKTSTLRDRLKGVETACQEAKLQMGTDVCFLELNGRELEDPTIDAGMRRSIEEFMNSHPQLTALFAFEYGYIPVLEVVLRDMGLQIPQDISLICFDAPMHNLNLLHPVTHVRQNEQQLAETAYALLKKRMEGKEVDYMHTIDVTFVPGETTALVPQRNS